MSSGSTAAPSGPGKRPGKQWARRPVPIDGFLRRGAEVSCAAAFGSDDVRAARWWLYCGGAVEKWGLRREQHPQAQRCCTQMFGST